MTMQFFLMLKAETEDMDYNILEAMRMAPHLFAVLMTSGVYASLVTGLTQGQPIVKRSTLLDGKYSLKISQTGQDAGWYSNGGESGGGWQE